ncbi:MAG: hypothetical protein ACYTG2_08395 [Planctomycetota bacterium]|jgi:hypothetical protein
MRTRPFLSCLPLLLVACGSPGGTRITPAEYERMQPAQQPSPAQVETARLTAPDKPLSDELVKGQQGLEKREIDLGRKREDHARAKAELDRKRHRTALEHEGAEAAETLALERAEREHGKAVEDLAHLTDVEAPRRLAEDALSLRGSRDNLLEVREELAQLEMMYSESSLGDATAEIVLNRTKRRLERMEQSVALREQRSEELKVRTLPRELGDAEMELRAKTVSLEEARRKAELGRLQREKTLRDLEKETRELAREAEDLEREAKLLHEDHERMEKKIEAHRSSASGLGGPTASGDTP